ncbi:MAG TPA: cyclic nucleotide-binding domain-containing protein [Actinomycetota bacterium]|jgi:CRP-like cAMP-binding protein
MPDDADRLKRLSEIPLFHGVPEDSLRRILDAATEFDAPAGSVLIQPGMAGSGLFVVEDGEVSVTTPGREPIAGGPGDFFGELALLTDGARTARVQAVTPVRCLAVGRGDFATLLEREPSIAVSMLATLARRLADAMAG